MKIFYLGPEGTNSDLAARKIFINNDDFGDVDPQLVRYFRTEYGTNWKSALIEHLYKKELNDDKKAA